MEDNHQMYKFRNGTTKKRCLTDSSSPIQNNKTKKKDRQQQQLQRGRRCNNKKDEDVGDDDVDKELADDVSRMLLMLVNSPTTTTTTTPASTGTSFSNSSICSSSKILVTSSSSFAGGINKSNDDTQMIRRGGCDPVVADDEEEIGMILELCMADERVVKTLEYAEQQPQFNQDEMKMTSTTTVTMNDSAVALSRRRDDSSTAKNHQSAMDRNNKDSSVEHYKNIATQNDFWRKNSDSFATEFSFSYSPLIYAKDDDDDEPELFSHDRNNSSFSNNTTSSSTFLSSLFAFHDCLPGSVVQLGTHEHSAFTAPPPPPLTSSSLPPSPLKRTTTVVVSSCPRCDEYWTDARKEGHILFKYKKLLDESSSLSSSLSLPNESLFLCGWSVDGQSFDLIDHPRTNAILAEIMGHQDSEINAVKRFRSRLYNFGFVKRGRTNFFHPLFRRDSIDFELILVIEQKHTKTYGEGASLHVRHCPVRRFWTAMEPPRRHYYHYHDYLRPKPHYQEPDATPPAGSDTSSTVGRCCRNNNNHNNSNNHNELDFPASPISLSAYTNDFRSRDSNLDIMIAEIIHEVFPSLNDNDTNAPTSGPDGSSSSTTSSFLAMTTTTMTSTTETNAD